MDLFFLTNANKVPQRAQLNNNLATNLNRISRCSRELLCHPYLCLFFFNLWWLLLASWDSSLCACGWFHQVRPWLGFWADRAAEPRLSHPILTKLCSGSSGWHSPATATLLLPWAVINWGLPSQPQPCCNVLQQLSLRVQFRVWQGEELRSSSNSHQIIPRAEAQNYQCSSPPLSSRFSSIITAILATRSLEWSETR